MNNVIATISLPGQGFSQDPVVFPLHSSPPSLAVILIFLVRVPIPFEGDKPFPLHFKFSHSPQFSYSQSTYIINELYIIS